VSIAATQAQQTQPRTRRSSKQETSGRLGIFMPQISGDENVDIKTKHDKELVQNNKKIQPRDTCATRHACVCVCVNSTSGGERSPATPAYQSKLTFVFLPLGAAVNKIKSAALTLPSAQGRPLARLHPTFPKKKCSTNTRSRTKLQSLSSSSMSAGPAGPCAGRSKPLSFAKSKSIG
jgi:hypothetical protein